MYYMCFKKRGQQGAETDIVRAKGIPTVLRQTLSEDDFRNVIFTDQPVRVESFRRIGTANHALHLAKCQKRVLSFLDTKRWWVVYSGTFLRSKQIITDSFLGGIRVMFIPSHYIDPTPRLWSKSTQKFVIIWPKSTANLLMINMLNVSFLTLFYVKLWDMLNI